MNCCAPINADTGRIFSTFARLHRLRFRLLGFETTQRQLIEGMRDAGLQGADLLEVGCGPGYLHRALLRSGATRATGVDLSAGMLAIARVEAEADGLHEQTDYLHGDFTQIADEVPDADVVILDKVVCCYPDWESLVDRSLGKTRRLYALTFPRDRVLTRAGIRAMRWGLGIVNCCYRPYIHDPAAIQARIEASGFRRVYAARTMTWLTQVYVRVEPGCLPGTSV
ncbi:MAG: class I SAM-dependent methyltransferase [Pseudomonadota bacterium]|nr:class I SAM-dependent methyltransferase [Pseudomonadota bacterium]